MTGGVVCWNPLRDPGSHELPPGSSGKRRVSVGAGTRRFLLLLVQPVKLAAELVKVLARFGKAVDLFELDL